MLSCPDHLVRLARLRAPGMRCALHPASGARRLEAGVKEVEQTSSAAAGECDGRFDTGKGRGSRAASSRRPCRMVDLATRPGQAERPQTLVEAAQTFVERPILLGTRFEIGTGGSGVVGTPAPLSNLERSRPLCLAAELPFAPRTDSRRPHSVRTETICLGPRWVSHPDAQTPSVPSPDTRGVRGEEAIVANRGNKLYKGNRRTRHHVICYHAMCYHVLHG